MQLLNTQDAALRLRLSVKTLEQWRSVGRGPIFSKLGHKVVYSEEDLAEFVRAARRSSTSGHRRELNLLKRAESESAPPGRADSKPPPPRSRRRISKSSRRAARAS